MVAPRRVLLEPAFLLHQRDYRDSSRIIEFFGHEHGRVALFAKGVRRPGSALAAVLQPFVPLLISWSGPGDGGTLTAAEIIALPPRMPPGALLSGFYLNELLLRLLGREDPYPDVHDAYTQALAELRAGAGERPLRLFEKRLLDALGLGLDYAREAGGGAPLAADAYYHVHAERGVVAAAAADSALAYRGRELLSLAAEALDDEPSLAAAKRLLRAALESPLEGRELNTRAVARALGRRPRAAPGADEDGNGGAAG